MLNTDLDDHPQVGWAVTGCGHHAVARRPFAELSTGGHLDPAVVGEGSDPDRSVPRCPAHFRQLALTSGSPAGGDADASSQT